MEVNYIIQEQNFIQKIYFNMIVAKKKLCSLCGEYKILWKSFPPTCNSCKSKSSIKKVSDKHKETLKEYKVVREEFLKQNPNCQLRLQGCSIHSTDVHHKLGKSSSELYLNIKYWMSLCRNCHSIIEKLGDIAYEKGFKLHRNQINE